MKILIVEDDFASRLVLKEFLSPYGDCDFAMNGQEAIEAVNIAYNADSPYSLICLDIMMPNTNGQEALVAIRDIEDLFSIKPNRRVKVIMTTALEDPKEVVKAYYEGLCDAYLTKPIRKQKLISQLKELLLI